MAPYPNIFHFRFVDPNYNLSNIPDNGQFYNRPIHALRGINFSSQNVGKSTLDDVYMNNMFQQAGINITNRNITGHFGKRTMCSKLMLDSMNTW